MSISKKLSLSLLSLTLIAGNALGMDADKPTEQQKIIEKLNKEIKDLQNKNTDLENRFNNQSKKLTDVIDTTGAKIYDLELALEKKIIEDLKKEDARAQNQTINSIFEYFKSHMNRSAVQQVGVQVAVEAAAWAMRKQLEHSSLSDDQVAVAERFIDAIQKASRAHLAATAITGAMNKAKTTKRGQRILNKDREYHANAYASLIASVSAQLLVDRHGNDNLACKAAPYIAGTVAGVAAGIFAPHKAFIN